MRENQYLPSANGEAAGSSLAVTMNRSGARSLRPMIVAVSWLILLVFLVTAIALWLRTTNQHEQELAHYAELQEQHLTTNLNNIEQFLTRLGEQIVALPRDGFLDQATELLQRAVPYHLHVEGLALLDTQGRFVAADFPIIVGESALPPEYGVLDDYLDMMNNPGFQVGRPYYFEPLQQWVIPLRLPLYNHQERLIGAISVAFKADESLTILNRYDLPEGTQIGLVRHDGYLTYLYPVRAEHFDPVEMYQQPVSEALQAILSQPQVVGSYLRPGTSHEHQGLQSYSAYTRPLPEFGQVIVVLQSKGSVVVAWLQSMILPVILLFLCAIAVFYAYRYAQRIIMESEQEVLTRQTALVKSLNRYAQLATMIPAGVYQVLLTNEGPRHFIFLSQRARDIFMIPDGLPLQQAMESIIGMMHPDDLNRFIETEEKATASSQPFRWEGRFLVEGEIKHIVIHSSPGSQEPNGVVWHGIMVDVTQERQAQTQLDELTHIDPVTSLPNRAFLHKHLHDALVSARKKRHFGFVLSLDLDNFKLLNDSVGQVEGDYALYLVGERLLHLLQENEIAARILADEFILVSPHCGNTREEALDYAEKYVHQLQELFAEPLRLHQDNFRVTVSIGVALLTPDSSSVESLLQQADQAMYEAKSQGRNTSVFFNTDMEERLQARLQLQRELHRAVLSEEIELYYQPKVDAAGRVYGVEALSRWLHPVKGMISPVEFIIVAEQSADILILGRWVLRTACQQLVKWSTDPVRQHWTMAVNISVKQLREQNFVEQVKDILTQSGAPADKLVLEITESMLLGNTEDAIEKMQKLKTVGVRFALDDFGTGYSNLNYLYRLPIDQIKIDQSFVRSLNKNKSQKQITQSVIALGHALALNVVAEGVETAEQYQELKAQGCDLFQGFYFSCAVRVSALKNEYLPEK
ncbi:MAG: EAL domain-containing protein [Firmicutes bacterium]|nr:EAL domain-containing protein [Bacillota bacterium]